MVRTTTVKARGKQALMFHGRLVCHDVRVATRVLAHLGARHGQAKLREKAVSKVKLGTQPVTRRAFYFGGRGDYVGRRNTRGSEVGVVPEFFD